MDRLRLDELKRRIPLLDYLRQHGWRPRGRTSGAQVAGLCPLHAETRPSFVVHTTRNLFYCHGCARGGDLIRLIELLEGIGFPAAVAKLRALETPSALIACAAEFYRAQLVRHPEAGRYLAWRGIHDPHTIDELSIGYAPGACLRAHLFEHGYSEAQMRAAGLLNRSGRDAFYRRIVFPSDGRLYGRSIDPALPPHRFLAGGKGGLYRWSQLRSAPELLLVEGAFDVAALHQAGFRNATCGWGAHLNGVQHEQLASTDVPLRIAFDGDEAGRRAARACAASLHRPGRDIRIVNVPDGYDPASFFATGGEAGDVQLWIEEAQAWTGA